MSKSLVVSRKRLKNSIRDVFLEFDVFWRKSNRPLIYVHWVRYIAKEFAQPGAYVVFPEASRILVLFICSVAGNSVFDYESYSK